MSYELFDVEKWVKDTLTGDSSLQGTFGGTVRYYQGHAPKGATHPYLLGRFVPLDDSFVQGATRVMAHLLLDLVLVNEGAPASITASVNTRCDALIGQAVNQLAGSFLISSRSRRPIMLTDASPENAEIFYTRRGRTFELWITAVS